MEESQRVSGEEQGSLEVGMLRDWRALICLGSRVEDEEDEAGGDSDGGDSVGEMAGEREEEEEEEEKRRESRRR